MAKTLNAARVASIVAAASSTVRVLDIADSAAQASAIRKWAIENGLTESARGAVSTDLVIKAAQANATVTVPHNGPIVVLTDDTFRTVAARRGKLTLDGVSDSAGVDVADVVGVIVDGAAVELPRRVAPVNAVAEHVITTHDGTEYAATGNLRQNVADFADSVGLDIRDIATINGRAVVVAYTLARADKTENENEIN